MENKNCAKNAMIIINVIAIIFLIVLFILLGLYYLDDIKLLSTEEGQIAFSEKLRTTGVWGAIILIVIQIFQVVVAFIPGEFVEIVSGMLFGPFLGMLLALIGLTFGTIVIFGLVRIFGKPFMDMNVSEKSKNKLSFLENKTRALIILFFVFLIPGTPKDFITYAIPFTKIKLWQFIAITSIARIPSIISSTIIGHAITTGRISNAIIITIITFVIALFGIIFNKQITNKVEQIVNKKSQKNEV